MNNVFPQLSHKLLLIILNSIVFEGRLGNLIIGY